MPTDEEFLTSNQNVIQEFRANSGVVSQLGFPVLLLTTTGARTGRRTTTPSDTAMIETASSSSRPRVARPPTQRGSTTYEPTRQ